MNKFAITLVLLSSIMHVSWNLIARHNKKEYFFFKSFLLWIIIIGFIPFIYLEANNILFPPEVWICLLFSGLFCSLYFFSLANAYKDKDFTVVYPVIRALPVVLVALGDTVRGYSPSFWGLTGMIMVLAGCVIIPYRAFFEIKLANYTKLINIWFLAGVLGTTGYSISDKIASELVVQGPVSAFRYAYLFFLVTAVYYLLILKLSGKSDSDKVNIFDHKHTILGAIMIFGAYWLVLWAFQLISNAGYIVALRQFSIVLGVLSGLILFHEKGAFIRITAALIVCTGILLISICG